MAFFNAISPLATTRVLHWNPLVDCKVPHHTSNTVNPPPFGHSPDQQTLPLIQRCYDYFIICAFNTTHSYCSYPYMPPQTSNNITFHIQETLSLAPSTQHSHPNGEGPWICSHVKWSILDIIHPLDPNVYPIKSQQPYHLHFASCLSTRKHIRNKLITYNIVFAAKNHGL